MSQYGNSPKNPPWARSGQNMSQSNAVPQSLMANPGMLQYPQVFQGQQAAAMGMNMSGLAQTAVAPMQAAMQATGQMYGAVQYPTRALNTAAFQQGQQQQNNSSQSGNKQRVFTGTVTKVQDNFGIVDEDIFFQSSCCVKGSSPQVGDRVLVEAVYNANMPFKWNATRIQVLSMQDGGQRSGQSYGRSQSNYNAVPPPKGNSGSPASNRFSGGGSRFSSGGPGDRGNRGGGGGGMNMNRGDMRRDDQDRKRRRDDRDKDDKAKSPPRKRSRSPVKQARRARRPPPRYSVTVPRTSLNSRDGDVVEIKKRYANMYIPSDFFLSEYRWTETFPIGKPISLDFPCSFHIFHKDVDPLEDNNAVLEPSDADYIYSAKVMLLASPGLDELYSKCIIATEERESSKSTVDEDSLSHPSRLINFLVGTRGKEYMAIGGPWSPSEDGENPSGDPSVLVRTAIRTTKALTGIDLSNSTQWFRFVEVHYHRSETVYRGKSYPARVETVVIFVPDVWSCVPTRLEWDELQVSFQKALARKLNDDDDQKEEEEEPCDKDSLEGTNTEKVKHEPKHYSELDPKNMKVSELREELEARSLSPKGLKSQLVARLSKSLKTEEEEESNKKATTDEGAQKKEVSTEKKEIDEKKKKEEEEKKKVDERERQLLEKRYKLPKKPHLLVYPNRTAKSGKFDCSVQSLSSLLGYRQDDTKEHSFEVSIFAELFNEMLMRDFGFNIYKAIFEAPEKPKEEKEKEKEKSKEDKEKDKPKDDKDKDKPKDDKEKDKVKDDDKDKEQKKDKESKSKEKDKDEKESEGKDEEMDVHSETEDQIEDEKESSTKDESVPKDSDSKDKKSDKDNRKERAKLITYDKMLLLSFTFFDITRCGYIYDKDIEDLLFSLGLTLSRSQIRKLLSKVVSRDAVYYRRLTDKPEGSPPNEHLPLSDLVGNKLILPSFLATQESFEKNGNEGETSEVKKGQLIMFNGSIIDVGKLMEQLTRSETARNETEKTLGKLRDELSKLKETTSKSEKHIKDLNADLRDYRERLAISNSELSSLQTKEKQLMRTLTEISDKIKPLIAKPEGAKHSQSEADTKSNAPFISAKEIIDLVEEKGEEPMAVDEDK